jgi:L,D-peptidoglycan transpeptidase YkuD (ErfK/YbiS/YcfS/YnhG family)
LSHVRRRIRRPAAVSSVAAFAVAAVLGAGSLLPAHSAATYRVQPGDTLAAVAARLGLTPAALAAANGLADGAAIKAGRVLVVPGVRAQDVNAPGTKIPYTKARQVVVADQTGVKRGTWARYEWRGTRWVKVSGKSATTFGYGGVKPGAKRVQGDGSTPAGTYPLLFAFGRADPGTAMPYRPITACSWWVSSKEADYNRWRESCAGRPRSGEHMLSYMNRRLYEQGVVIGFNYADPVRSGRGSGAGIFLHYSKGNTAGCVGLTSMTELTDTVRWLDPAANPQIVIKS